MSRQLDEIKEQIEGIEEQVNKISESKKKKKIIVYKERLEMVLFAFVFILTIASLNITRAIDVIDKINPASSILSLFIVAMLIVLLSYIIVAIIKFLIQSK